MKGGACVPVAGTCKNVLKGFDFQAIIQYSRINIQYGFQDDPLTAKYTTGFLFDFQNCMLMSTRKKTNKFVSL